MRTNAKTIALGLICSTFFVSCGDKHGLVPVSGKVLYDGKPAVGANVYFHPKSVPNPPPKPAPPLAQATVEADGTFHLQSGDWGYGALPGEYNVLVEYRDPADRPDPAALNSGKKNKQLNPNKLKTHTPPDKFKGKYANLSKPLLTAEVKPRSNSLPPFELKE
jgi:hypothetical protein